MSANALVISTTSDGLGAACTKPRAVRDDEPLKRYLAKKLEFVLNSSGLNPTRVRFDTLDQLPHGYSGWSAPRQQRTLGQPVYEDKYIAGHPKGQPYLSYLAFFDHFCWLQWYGQAPGLPCCLCTDSERGKDEGLRTPVPNGPLPPLQVVNVLQPAVAAPTVPALPTMSAPMAAASSLAPAPPVAAAPAATPQTMAAPTAGVSFFAPAPPAAVVPQSAPFSPGINQTSARQSSISSSTPAAFKPGADLDIMLSEGVSDQEMSDLFQTGSSSGQEAAEEFEQVSVYDDIEIIKRYARIVREQIDL